MVDEAVPREHPTEAAGGRVEAVDRPGVEGDIGVGSPCVLDEGGDEVDASDVAPSSGEMSGPVPRSATRVEDRTADLIGPCLHQVTIRGVHGVHRPQK